VKGAPAAEKPTSATETDEDYPFMVKVALFGIVVAVVAVWLRFSRGQSRDEVAYEKKTLA
jgi:uncharacterized membrane protein